MDGALALQKGALRARSAERKTEKEKLKEKEREREKRRKESRASARALVCYGRRAHARSEIRPTKARSGRALQTEKEKLKEREREREKEREQGERARARVLWTARWRSRKAELCREEDRERET